MELTVESLRHPKFRGVQYKRLKSFGKEKKAKEYLKKIEETYKSKRLPPIIEQVNIGWKFGSRYYVCVPENMVKYI
jgi:hypothetical protein